MHDPALGRFFSIDPLADEYTYNSPYAFAENKLGLGIELEGLELGLYPSLVPVVKTVGTHVANFIKGSEMSTKASASVSFGPQAGIDLPGAVEAKLNIASAEVVGYSREQSGSDSGPVKEELNYFGKEGKATVKQGAGLGLFGFGVGAEREFVAKKHGGYEGLKDGGSGEAFFLKVGYSETENSDGSTKKTLTFSLTGGAAFIIGVDGSIDVNFSQTENQQNNQQDEEEQQ